MDRIQAFNLQQQRSSKEKTLEELRTGNSRWAVAFDMSDEDSDGLISLDDAVKAFKRIIGGASMEVPAFKIKETFTELDALGRGKVDFRKFHQLTSDVSHYMSEFPRWKEDDAEAADREERRLAAQARQRRESGADVFGMLGIQKSKDSLEAEARKEQALGRALENAKEKLKSAGAAIISQAPTVIRRSCQVKRTATIQETSSVSNRILGLQACAGGGTSPNVSPSSSSTSGAFSVGSLRFELGSQHRAAFEQAAQVAGRSIVRRATIDVAADMHELKLSGYGAACFSLRFSPDGSKLAGGYLDGGLRIFDVDSATQLYTVNLTPRSTREKIASAGSDFEVSDVRLKSSRGSAMMNLRWLPTAGTSRQGVVATVDTKGTIGLWEIPFNSFPKVLAEVPGEIELNALTFSRDGAKMMVGGQERVVKVYDVHDVRASTATPLQQLGSSVAGHRMKVLSICAFPNHPDLLVSGAMDRSVLVWDLRAPRGAVAGLSGIELSGDALDISKDGVTLLAGSHRSENPLQFFDLRKLNKGGDSPTSSAKTEVMDPCQTYHWSGELVKSEEQSAAPVATCLLFSIAWDAENRTIVAAGEKGNAARVFSRSSNGSEGNLRVVKTFEGKARAFYSAAISANGKTAAFGSSDGSVNICSATR